MSDWTAYCAPGHRVDAALVLMLAGENVDGVKESWVLRGSAIILVNHVAIADALTADLPCRTEISPPSGIWSRSPFDPLRMLCEDLSREPGRALFPPITGV